MRRTLIISILLLVACGSSIETIRDDFDGVTIYRLKNNILGVQNVSFGIGVRLNVQKLIMDSGGSSYSLVVHIIDKDWLFISEGESLVLLIDGNRIGFTGEGSLQHRNTADYGNISEVAYYRTDAETIKRIANASEVRVKIQGSERFLDKKFNQSNFESFKNFAQIYIQ